jgi:hypothetical protein
MFKNAVFGIEFGKPKVKECWPKHVPNFKELVSEVDPTFIG